MGSLYRIITAFFCLFLSVNSFAEEGMWLLNNFPTQKVQEKYHFTATQPWLDHVRLSSARLAGGCSASFVSQNGLVLTNHHCAHACIEQLSKAGKDYVASGFYAKTEQEEVKCPDIEINRLVDISDVTSQIHKATGSSKGKEFNDELKAAMSKIEKECSGGADDIRCDVVTLYHGGQYHLYKYQRYQDVRLVFAPEFSIAFFGGDPDNFMFPRYDFDLSFLRVYSHDKPLQSQDYFQWSKAGASEKDLTFVTGHPGHTGRLLTISELEYARDIQYVEDLMYLSELRGLLTEFQKRGPEQKRISNGRLFGVENGLKAMTGQLQTLTEKSFFQKKVIAENTLRRKVEGNPNWKKEFGSAWTEIEKAHVELKKIHKRLGWIENTTYGSRLFSIARGLVRAAAELPKPNEKRFREFADSNLPRLKQTLFSTAPLYDEFEIETMTFSLTKMREKLTADDPFVKKVFGQKSPAELAESLIKGTHLKDVAQREALFNGGQKEIEASKDPMIQFALLVDPDAREVRKTYEDEIETVIKQNGEKVAQAQFAVYGSKTYPDATFTLRITYGQMLGYEEDGKFVKPWTTIQGAFDRHTGREPFALPDSWLRAKSSLNLQTPLNICTTNDIIGGNSGSPVINKDAQIVGLIFDGNIQSLGGDFGYDQSVNRAIAVDSASITEVLKRVYGAERIVDDLLKQK